MDNSIIFTRGDTYKCSISIADSHGNEYALRSGDKLKFTVKKNAKDNSILIQKYIQDQVLELQPCDTKNLGFGKYVYDIELTLQNGEIYTIIKMSELILTEEVG